MTPSDLETFLQTLVTKDVFEPVMIWGAPGIGKSTIVATVAEDQKIDRVDLRLSQLAPSDLRGLPVPEKETRTANWYPPDFLPREGSGILFLDEINMAPPVVQGIAQQLVLDRKVGNYELPTGWHVWAAGNRKEDRAAVFDFSSALANRFLHLEIDPDFDSFRDWGIHEGVDDRILSFLALRVALLHKMDSNSPNWPSPRTWAKADVLLKADLDISPAVGNAAASEFRAYLEIFDQLPNIDLILNGQGEALDFPSEPSRRYAVTYGLGARAKKKAHILHSFSWLVDQSAPEWCQLFLQLVMEKAEEMGTAGSMAVMLEENPKMSEFLNRFNPQNLPTDDGDFVEDDEYEGRGAF
ncbi:MAG: ATPase [Opitutae bacterium]|nr:ATPase [Opitutae bacterium]|tara:strand:+ start:8393 stop:9454 length:1062 start_codon:yes stop_codon:yes gene_type:complete